MPKEPQPSWLQRIALRVAGFKGRALTPPPYFSPRHLFVGVSDKPSHDRLLANLQGWVAIAANAIANRITTIELQVFRRTSMTSGTVEENQLDNHPLKELLDRPNPVFSRRMLLRLIATWLSTVGEAYLLKISGGSGRFRNQPQELWPLEPELVFPRFGEDRTISGYLYMSQAGRTIEYAAEEVVRIWQPSPLQLFTALGPFATQALGYDASKFLDETMRSHFESDASPKVVITAEKDAQQPDPDVRDRFYQDWRQKFDNRRGKNRGLPAMLPSGFDLQVLPSLGGFTDSIDLMNHYRDRIFMAYGIPRSVVGDVVDANRAAAETNQWVFDRNTIQPLTDLIAEALNEQLVDAFGEDLFVRFEDFVMADKQFVLASERQDLELKVRSINEVRADRGLDDAPWGEEPVGALGETPYRPDEGDPTGEEPVPEELEEEEAEEEEEEERSRASWFDLDVEYARQVDRERRFTPVFRDTLRGIFTIQRHRTLERLAKAVEGERAIRVAIEDVFTPEEWDDLFEVRTGPLWREMYVSSATEAIRGFGLDPEDVFVFSDEVAAILKRYGAQMVSRINGTTRKKLNQEIVEAVKAGDSIDAIVTRINRVFRERRSNAQAIARTEVLRGTQAGQLEGFRSSGVVRKKQWNTSRDAFVRDSHGTTEGQVVALNEPFVLGDGETADAPGLGASGADLSPANAINCRCFVTPVVLE